MKMIKTLFLSIAIMAALPSFSQSQNMETLLPTKDVNQTIRKIGYSVMGIGSSVHVDINCDMNNYTKCIRDNVFGRLDIEINWYNANDETGKFTLNMMKDMQMIPQEMADFKKSSGFEQIEKAKEVLIAGGKYWIFTQQKQCVNEITGPSGETEHHTQIRSYLFDGIKTIKLDLKGYFTPDKAKEIMLETVQNIKKIDFSALANVVVSK
jgi:hypothetical protein